MFEQERHETRDRSQGIFRAPDRPAAGVSRFQVSSTDDPEEVQADRMADSVVGGGLFRSPEGAGDMGGQADLADADLSGGESALPADLMGSMEQSFGTSFSNVRLHTGAGADRASRQINARAFTRGQDIYFRGGEYSPDTQEGQHLIAHELAHVAAGDTGIHRAGDSGAAAAPQQEVDPDVAKRDEGRRALEDRTEISRICLRDTNTAIGQSESIESVGTQIKAGTLGKADLERRKSKIEDIESGMEYLLPELQSDMDAYASAETKVSGNADTAKGSVAYTEAQKVKEQLEDAKPQLDTAKQAVQWGLETATAKEGGASGDSPFPKAVDDMLNNPACGQFFKAVEQVRGSAAGASDFAALNDTAGTAAAAAGPSADSAEAKNAKYEKMSDNLDKANVAIGAGSFVTDMISADSDLNTEEKGDNMTQEDENYRHGSAAGSTVTALAATGTGIAETHAARMTVKNQEEARAKKLAALQGSGMETMGSADHKGRVGVAAKSFGTMGNMVGVGSSIAGGFRSDNDPAGEANNALGVAGSGLSTIGDTLGLGADAQSLKEQRQRDAAAKENMRNLGKQLEGTLPAERKGRSGLIAAVCERVKGSKFNAVKGADNSLSSLIKKAIEGGGAAAGNAQNAQNTQNTQNNQNPPAQEDLNKPELTSKQKMLLTSMQALETSRGLTKAEVAKGKWDVALGAMSLAGTLTSLAGNLAKMVGGTIGGTIAGIVGSAIGLVGNLIGAAKSAKDAHDAKKAEAAGEKDERSQKVAACQAAVGQMAALPPLSLEGLRTAKQQQLPLPNAHLEAAEQYAAVFSIVDAANVSMVDFLYAIQQGGFGSKDAQGNAKGAGDSLRDMYANLDFTG